MLLWGTDSSASSFLYTLIETALEDDLSRWTIYLSKIAWRSKASLKVTLITSQSWINWKCQVASKCDQQAEVNQYYSTFIMKLVSGGNRPVPWLQHIPPWTTTIAWQCFLIMSGFQSITMLAMTIVSPVDSISLTVCGFNNKKLEEIFPPAIKISVTYQTNQINKNAVS